MTDPERERIEALIEHLECEHGSPLVCRAVMLKAAAQLRSDHPAQGERTPQDYAIEFGGYLAERAVAFLRLMEEPDKGADNPDLQAEVYLALRSAVYEFRKRAARCAPDVHVAVSPEAVDEVIAQMPPPVAPAQPEATPTEQGGGGADAAASRPTIKCSRCNGAGVLIVDDPASNHMVCSKPCERCAGIGRIPVDVMGIVHLSG